MSNSLPYLSSYPGCRCSTGAGGAKHVTQLALVIGGLVPFIGTHGTVPQNPIRQDVFVFSSHQRLIVERRLDVGQPKAARRVPLLPDADRRVAAVGPFLVVAGPDVLQHIVEADLVVFPDLLDEVFIYRFALFLALGAPDQVKATF